MVTIGVLAGMGPKSTAPFIDQLMTEYQMNTGAHYDIDFPPILIYSLPTPFYPGKPIDHTLMQSTIAQGLKRLESYGVDLIAMPCNFAHRYFSSLQAELKIPLLNMIDETVKCIPSGAKKVAILATKSTMEAGVYQTRLKERGLECVISESVQTRVDQFIAHIKEGKIEKERFQEFITDVAEGVDQIILACTDLNVLAPNSSKMIDSMQSLARATVEHYLLLKSLKKPL